MEEGLLEMYICLLLKEKKLTNFCGRFFLFKIQRLKDLVTTKQILKCILCSEEDVSVRSEFNRTVCQFRQLYLQ